MVDVRAVRPNFDTYRGLCRAARYAEKVAPKARIEGLASPAVPLNRRYLRTSQDRQRASWGAAESDLVKRSLNQAVNARRAERLTCMELISVGPEMLERHRL
jgi:hypothetical protein